MQSGALRKAAVEGSVLLAQRWILAGLGDQTFFTLGALNAVIRVLLDELNDRTNEEVRRQPPRSLRAARPARPPTPAGVAAVIAHPDLEERGPSSLPKLLRYAIYVHGGSRPNTPLVFAIYVVSLVTAWLRDQSGLQAGAARNERKAAKLYAAIDRTDFYRGVLDPDSRSRLHATFRLPPPELEAGFIHEAEAANLSSLKGHRSVDGLRVL